jgi:predicted dehydrogenase
MTLRIGILGAARVAVYAMIAAAKDVDGVVVAGIAARDGARARAYAQTHGIPLWFEGYDAIIASPDIDAIYVALPPDVHAKWSIAAAEAGKPVLCEKPFTLDPAEVEAIIAAEARTGQIIAEAQHSHYHPLADRMRQIVQGKTLGKLTRIDAVFDVPIPDVVGEHRYIEAMGGGALWDLGLYAAYWIRSVTGEEPIVVSATERRHPDGANLATTAQLKLPSGAHAELVCDMEAPLSVRFRAEGENGTLDVTNPLAPQHGHSLVLTDKSGVTTTEQFPLRPSFSYQLEAFRDAVMHGKAMPTRGKDSLATIRLLSAIRDAARKE